MKKYLKPPYFSTNLSENGKSAKRRITNILDSRAKKLGTAAVVLILAAALATGAMVTFGGENRREIIPATKTEDFRGMTCDEAVSLALSREYDKYAEAEFWTQGHIILGTETNEKGTKIYAVTSVGGYSFVNGGLFKDTGSGAIPAVVTVTKNSVDIEFPKDGAYYLSSLKEMLPPNIYLRYMLKGDQAYYSELKKQEEESARAYAKELGRDLLDEYTEKDMEMPRLSPEAELELSEYEKSGELYKFPMNVGTREYIEDGERYIYEKNWQESEGMGILTYRKYKAKDVDINGGNVYSVKFYIKDGRIISVESYPKEINKQSR